MFQLTTLLTPAPGRAGLPGVPGAGGGKSVIDLPDFMTFASSGVPAPASGNARQNPAGDGEAMPGGAILIPPAGHPDTHDVAIDMISAATLPIAAGEPDAERVSDISIAVDASARPVPMREVPVRIPINHAASKATLARPSSDTPLTGDDDVIKTVALVSNRRPVREPADDAPPAKPSPGPDATLPVASTSSASGELIPVVPVTTAVALLVEPQGQAVASAAEADMPSNIVSTANRPALATVPVATAMPGEVIPSSTTTMVDDRAPSDKRITPQSRFAAAGAGVRLQPRTAQPFFVGTEDKAPMAAPVKQAASDPRVVIPPCSVPVIGRGSMDAQPLPVRDRNAAGPVSLGTIAQMLGGVVPAAPPAANPAPLPTSAAALPAMPASVATFLASVAPQPLVSRLSGALPKGGQRPLADAGVAATPTATAASLATPVPVVIQPARQLFAEAIHAATGLRDRPYRAPGDEIVALAGTAPSPTLAASVVADRAPLDMTQGHWPMKMIERIEVLRDAADAQDTRIKLIPDALGAIDVSMRRDGDIVRVHLAAERPETRALIADAQPRLAELGEQRGLKIAASSGQANGQALGQSGAQDFHQQRGNPAPQQPARPASARAGDQPVTDDDGDQRLA